jgi:putative FmdB family regulatory protein
MPIFKYTCKNCNLSFDKLLPKIGGEPQTECINCGKMADKQVSVSNFEFSGKTGNSGVHDLDYPGIDKAVGRSAEKRWTAMKDRQKVAVSAIDEYKTNKLAKVPVAEDEHTYIGLNKNGVESREKSFKTYHNALKSGTVIDKPIETNVSN